MFTFVDKYTLFLKKNILCWMMLSNKFPKTSAEKFTASKSL